MAGNRVTITNHDEMFKEFYIPASEAAIHTATPFRSTVKRISNFTGKQITGVATLSSGAGIGNNVIPAGSTRKRSPINYTPEALWGTVVLDWESMVSSGDDKGAFFNVTIDEVEGMMTAFLMNEERQFFGTHNGILGAYSAAPTNNGDGTWTVTITAATWFFPNWQAGNIINFATNTDQFEITTVDKVDKQITVERRSGSYMPESSSSGNIYMQNSKDKELIGLSEITDKVDDGSATLYGPRIQPYWAPKRLNGGSKPLVPDMITDMVESQYDETGFTFTDVWLNSKQYASLSNQLEGKKEYTQLKPMDSRYADMGWKGLKMESRHGEVQINTARFCPEDEVMFTSRGYMEVRERPKFGWLTFDGTKFLRAFNEGERPYYKAHYGGFEHFFHHPALCGKIYDLEVPSTGVA